MIDLEPTPLKFRVIGLFADEADARLSRTGTIPKLELSRMLQSMLAERSQSRCHHPEAVLSARCRAAVLAEQLERKDSRRFSGRQLKVHGVVIPLQKECLVAVGEGFGSRGVAALRSPITLSA